MNYLWNIRHKIDTPKNLGLFCYHRTNINGEEILAMIDMGATASITETKLKELSHSHELELGVANGLFVVNGQPLSTLGTVNLRISIGDMDINQVVTVVKDMHIPTELLLGPDFLCGNKIRLTLKDRVGILVFWAFSGPSHCYIKLQHERNSIVPKTSRKSLQNDVT